ncbi:MAG TPA: Hsp20/alpha crystallin family protein [Gemmatimonadales bacterium]
MYLTTTRRPLPFQSLRRLGNALDEAFNTWPFNQDEGGAITSSWYPACDVLEDKDSVKIIVELPGLTPDDVKLSLENNVLSIRGEKKQQAEERTERVHRYERSYGTFERSFALPTSVDSDKVSASFQNGILTVTVPKAERARPREIPVKVG